MQKRNIFIDRMQTLPYAGQIHLSLPRHEQRDRTVVCEVRLGTVTIASPDRKGRSSLTPLTFYEILVREEQNSFRSERAAGVETPYQYPNDFF